MKINGYNETERGIKSFDTMKPNIEKTLNALKNFKEALDQASIVAITDLDGNITYVNDKFCEISKYSRDELIGQNHRTLKSGYHSTEFYEDLWRTISSGKTWHGLFKNKAKDGSYYWVQSIIIPFKDDSGKIFEYIAIRTDITKQIEITEKLTESNKTIKEQTEALIRVERFSAIGKLVSNLAHDIRNPLTVIKGNMEFLRRAITNLSEKETERFTRIDESVDIISHQINNVLDFIKTSRMNIEENSIFEILESALQDFIVPKDIIIEKVGKDIVINCDFYLMRTVFVNLIRNSIQAIGKKGEIKFKITDKSDKVTIQVQDSGLGISEGALDKLFESLFTTKQEGTGLGLSSCKTLVELHGGTISVKNNPTTFTIELPLVSKN